MNTARVRDAYRQSESQGKIHPVKLIHMLYERLLDHLALAEEGILEENLQKRGESLGKAIAILAELHVSIKEDDDSEAAQFLRGLYSTILAELPKVSITNDVHIVRQSSSYILRLKEMWEQTAMKEQNVAVNGNVAKVEIKPVAQGYSAKAKNNADQSLSVSI